MAWFRVDDSFHSSKPVMRIPRRYRAQVVGLWTMAGTWSSQEELDGFVPEYALEELCGTPALAAQLVRAGLWEEVTGESQEGSSICGESGWRFRNWSKYNPTRDELEEKREKERIRKANYRMSQRDKDGTPAGQTEGHQPESAPPDPTRPDPLTEAKASVPRKRGKRIGDDFQVTPEMQQWAAEKCPNVHGPRETEKFINYWTAKSGKDATKQDWPATWRNWMLNAEERAGSSRGPQRQTGGSKAMDTLRLAEQMEGGLFDGFEGNRAITG